MRLILILFLTTMLSACKTKSGDTAEAPVSQSTSLYDEVMAIHDEVMPEMATIHRLKKQLEDAGTPENSVITGTQIKSLNEADDAMMSWMAMFKLPENKVQEAAYLESEKIKITEVRNQMYKAMEDAKKTLDSLKNHPQ